VCSAWDVHVINRLEACLNHHATYPHSYNTVGTGEGKKNEVGHENKW